MDNATGSPPARFVADEALLSTTVHYAVSGDTISSDGGIALGTRHIGEIAADDDWIRPLDEDDLPRTPEMMQSLKRFGDILRRWDPQVGVGGGLCGGRFDAGRGGFVTVVDAELVGAVASSWLGGNQFPCCSVHAVRTVDVVDERHLTNFEVDYGHAGPWPWNQRARGRVASSAASSGARAQRPGNRPPSWWPRMSPVYGLRNLAFLMRQGGLRLVALRVSLLNLAKPLYNLPRSQRLTPQHLGFNGRAVADAYRGRMGRSVEPIPKPCARRV